MLIRSYGLFWERDEVNWFPGQGRTFVVAGRMNKNLPGLRLADFRDQRGIYVLYSDYGPYYVGLTIESGIGSRLRDHCKNGHANGWRRFSWFGFCDVAPASSKNLYDELRPYKRHAKVDTDTVIEDIEALMIRTMGPTNQNEMNFHDAECWTQVPDDELEAYEAKLCKHKGLAG